MLLNAINLGNQTVWSGGTRLARGEAENPQLGPGSNWRPSGVHLEAKLRPCWCHGGHFGPPKGLSMDKFDAG